MKKSIAILLALTLIISTAFVACSNNTKDDEASTSDLGIEEGDVFGFEDIEVTDENGETVTDDEGKPLTTEVPVKYENDKKDKKTKAKLLDENGNVVTDAKGKEVTVDTSFTLPSTTKKQEKETKKTTTTTTTTAATKKEDQTTQKDLTTKKDYVAVPSTSETGDKVIFSAEDQQVIKNMLEVPYLYEASYENSQGVPINIATHAAIWMSERSGLSPSSFAAGTVVIDLFRYFGQTVVNFKIKCNDAGNANITYNSTNDTFAISSYEEKTHTVTIESFEDLGGNNYYKVTGKVSGAKGIKKVVAIVQKNRLDNSLGFSIKALKWS